MEKIFFIIVIVIAPFVYYRHYKKGIREYLEKEKKEYSMTPKEKEDLNIKQDQKHIAFIYLAIVGIFLMLLFKDTRMGFFIGDGSILLVAFNSFELLMRWFKNQPWHPKILIISMFLFLVIVSLQMVYFSSQFNYSASR